MLAARDSRFFHEELKTSDWIRATSPACNCNISRRILTREHSSKVVYSGITNSEWPGLLTCAADREDHGTTGAYTAWPALAAEALCYIEGNCSCVDTHSPLYFARLVLHKHEQMAETHTNALDIVMTLGLSAMQVCV